MRHALSVFLVLLLSTFACISAEQGPLAGADGGPDDGSDSSDPWLPLEGYVGALALDADSLFVGVGAEVLAVDRNTAESRAIFDVSRADESWYIDAIYVGDDVLVVVAAFQDFRDINNLTLTRQMWSVPKAGGDATMLDESSDSRAYLGAFVRGDQVYYSVYTSLLKRPLAGGAASLVAQSPGSISYWVLTPSLYGDWIYWAEDNTVYKIAVGDSSEEGVAVASFATGDYNGLALHPDGDSNMLVSVLGLESTSIVSLHAETDATQELFSFSPLKYAQTELHVAATETDLWIGTITELFHVERSGTTQVQVHVGQVNALVSEGDTVYAAVEGGVLRY